MFCPNCGKEISDNARFCNSCGSKVAFKNNANNNAEDADSNIAMQKGKNKKSNTIMLIISIIIAVIIMAIAAFVFLFKGNKSENGTTKNGITKNEITKNETNNDEATKNVKITSKESTNYKLEFVSSDISAYPTVRLYYKIYDMNGNVVNNFDIAKAALNERINGGEYLIGEVKVHENLGKRYGLNTSLVVDKSGSISDVDMNKIKDVLSSFTGKMDFSLGDKAEIVTFDGTIYTACPFSGDYDVISGAINSIFPGGNTAFYDAVHSGIVHSSLQGGARCVIAFTDGIDNESRYSYNDVIDFSLKQQVPVYVIGIGHSLTEDTLRTLANSTGGMYWNIDDLYDLEGIFDEIYGIEKSTYYIEYVSGIPGREKFESREINLKLDNGDEYVENYCTFAPVVPEKIGHDTDIEWNKRIELMPTVLERPQDTPIDDLDSIPFGNYEQDNNLSNGKEPIDWIILKKENGYVMLMSKYILDCQQFNTTKMKMQWSQSSLRYWLNNTFLNEAFNSSEQELIPTVTVANFANKKMGVIPTEFTEDKVYMLDDNECVQFFGEPSQTNQLIELATRGTEYAKSKGMFIDPESNQWFFGNSTYWLRSPGMPDNRAGNVTYAGYFYQDGNSVDFKLNGVRPVIWVKYQ